MARQLKPPTPERGEAEEKVRAALIAGQYREASRIVAEYEAKQAVPRGIGIDWKRYDPNRDVPGLTAIYTRIPAILHGVRDDALPSLRFAAAMKYLWGMSKPYRRWLPAEAKGDAAAAALVSEAYEAQQEKAFLYIRDSLMVTPPRVAELLDRVAKRRDAT